MILGSLIMTDILSHVGDLTNWQENYDQVLQQNVKATSRLILWLLKLG